VPPSLPGTESYPGAGAPVSDYFHEPWERDAQGFLETDLQNIPYYPCAIHEEYEYIPCGIKKKGMKTHHDNMHREENTALHFPSIENRDGIQKHVASMTVEQCLGEGELHTPEDMKWNDNDQRPIT